MCQAASGKLAGTTHYIAITMSANGLNGHFLNNGTPKAGHEEDFIASVDRHWTVTVLPMARVPFVTIVVAVLLIVQLSGPHKTLI